MPLSSFGLRTALFARLDAQLTTPIFSYVPQNTLYPYIRVGDVTASTQDTQTTGMQLYSVSIHTFDKSVASSQTVEGIMQNIYGAIHNYPLVISGYTVVYCRQSNLNVFQQGEPNDRYWHGIQTFDIMVQDS